MASSYQTNPLTNKSYIFEQNVKVNHMKALEIFPKPGRNWQAVDDWMRGTVIARNSVLWLLSRRKSLNDLVEVGKKSCRNLLPTCSGTEQRWSFQKRWKVKKRISEGREMLKWNPKSLYNLHRKILTEF